MRPLEDLRVLITQSSPNHIPLRDRIEHEGGRTFCHPLLSIEKRPISSLKAQALCNAEVCVFLSQHSVRFASPLFHTIADSATFVAIGPSTARVLEEYGYNAATVPKTFSRQGVSTLPVFSSPKRIVIFTSAAHNAQKPTLVSLLRAQGHLVVAVTTHTASIAKEAFRNAPLSECDIITVHSHLSLQYLKLHTLSFPDLSSIPLCLISANMRTNAQKLGFCGPIIFSKNPTSEAILAALGNWWHTETLKTST